jgi:hypothetical protein
MPVSLTLMILAYMPIFTGSSRLLMLLPLVLAISVVYKTLKQPRLKDLPVSVLALWATIVVGMIGLGIGLLLLYRVFS